MAQAISGDGRRRIAECDGSGSARQPNRQPGRHRRADGLRADIRVRPPEPDRRLTAANGAPTLTTTGGATDILGFEYVAALSKWCSLGAPFPQGF